MSISTIQNFYKETITRAVTLTGATNIYVSALPTPAEGYVVISPSSSTLREIVYYTAKGTDGNGTYLTITLANRGLGGTTAQTHAIGEPVRMNVTAEHIKEISDALDQIVAGGAQDASTVTKGITKLSVAPASATEPIAVGTNDPRFNSLLPTGTVIPYAGIVPKEITYDNSKIDETPSLTSTSFTVGTGLNRLLLVAVATRYDSVTAVTYGGVPMTFLQKTNQSGSGNPDEMVSIYYLVAPASGEDTISVTVGHPIYSILAISYSGVNQTTPFDTYSVKSFSNSNNWFDTLLFNNTNEVGVVFAGRGTIVDRLSAGTNLVARQIGADTRIIADTNGPLSLGSQTLQIVSSEATTGQAAYQVIRPSDVSLEQAGFLFCNGNAVSRETYSTLFGVISTTYGVGDGSSTFNIPDLRGKMIVGSGLGSKIFTFVSRSSNNITVSGVSNSITNEIQTGQAVYYSAATTAMTGLTNKTTYYIIRTAYNQFSLASSVAEAVAGSAISLSSDGVGVQTFTLQLTKRSDGETGGTETSSLNTGGAGSAATGTVGGTSLQNNMSPFTTLNYIIKT